MKFKFAVFIPLVPLPSFYGSRFCTRVRVRNSHYIKSSLLQNRTQGGFFWDYLINIVFYELHKSYLNHKFRQFQKERY